MLKLNCAYPGFACAGKVTDAPLGGAGVMQFEPDLALAFVMVQPVHPARMVKVTGPFLQSPVMEKHCVSAELFAEQAVKLQGVPWLSKLQLLLNAMLWQPDKPVIAAAGETMLSMITGAAHATAPVAAARRMSVRRLIPRFSSHSSRPDSAGQLSGMPSPLSTRAPAGEAIERRTDPPDCQFRVLQEQVERSVGV
jgi:hypothetical protein